MEDKIRRAMKHKRMPLAFFICEMVTLVILFVATILCASMIPSSFSYVEYDQIAFRKGIYTGEVDKDTLYTNGRYHWGLGYEALTFPAQYININFLDKDNLLVFSKNGLEYWVECSLQYLLQRNNLKKLYETYNVKYHTQIVNMARSVIKNKLPEYSIDELSTKRKNISYSINLVLQETANNIWVDIPEYNFQLKEIIFPDNVRNKFLANAVQIQRNKESEFQQQADLIRKQTETLVSSILSNITIIERNTLSQMKEIQQKADAEAFRIIQAAESNGLKFLFETLNINDNLLKNDYLKLFAIMGHDNTKLLRGDFDVLIS